MLKIELKNTALKIAITSEILKYGQIREYIPKIKKATIFIAIINGKLLVIRGKTDSGILQRLKSQFVNWQLTNLQLLNMVSTKEQSEKRHSTKSEDSTRVVSRFKCEYIWSVLWVPDVSVLDKAEPPLDSENLKERRAFSPEILFEPN